MKLREFGTVFMGEITGYLQTNARQIFADESFTEPAIPQRTSLNDTSRETVYFFRQGKSVPEIALVRGLKESTIYGHLEEALRAGEAIDLDRLLDTRGQQEIGEAF